MNLDALARLMITEDLGAWTPSLRSKARLRTRPVRHLADPCLAVAALRASPKALLADWDYTGLLFENMALRDVRVYLDAIGGTTYHYRDSNGLEVDIIVELDDGRWGAIEVKLGENRIEEGAESLTQFARTVNLRAVGQPSFLAVLTGANVYATRRPDGIDVIAIATLGPSTTTSSPGENQGTVPWPWTLQLITGSVKVSWPYGAMCGDFGL